MVPPALQVPALRCRLRRRRHCQRLRCRCRSPPRCRICGRAAGAVPLAAGAARAGSATGWQRRCRRSAPPGADRRRGVGAQVLVVAGTAGHRALALRGGSRRCVTAAGAAPAGAGRASRRSCSAPVAGAAAGGVAGAAAGGAAAATGGGAWCRRCRRRLWSAAARGSAPVLPPVPPVLPPVPPVLDEASRCRRWSCRCCRRWRWRRRRCCCRCYRRCRRQRCCCRCCRRCRRRWLLPPLPGHRGVAGAAAAGGLPLLPVLPPLLAPPLVPPWALPLTVPAGVAAAVVVVLVLPPPVAAPPVLPLALPPAAVVLLLLPEALPPVPVELPPTAVALPAPPSPPEPPPSRLLVPDPPKGQLTVLPEGSTMVSPLGRVKLPIGVSHSDAGEQTGEADTSGDRGRADDAFASHRISLRSLTVPWRGTAPNVFLMHC